MSVGKAILRIRRQRGLTQAVVSRRADLAASYLSRIENGHVQPTTGMLTRIAAAMRVKPSAIFAEDERGTPAAPHHCPVSSSGACIGEQIRSGRGRRPAAGRVAYGSGELEILRMTDYLVLHGSPEVRRALRVVLESMMAGTPARQRGRRGSRPSSAS